ncbi:MAG: ABC transporter permease [Butyrivibrio sp.]|uniref:ABC transporter permease n=1 Tax=Butyrivibrio sp. TaxID=28121 RepID=UPI0025DA6E59|nr:ABC transporter permease [Butyrivibrio sp.]MCR5771452.1 ABC transporter permease [Butyrivibrio sp.]
MSKNYLREYIRIEYKRMLKSFGHMLLSIMVMALVIGLGMAGIGFIMTHLTDYEKVTVAMVLPESDETDTLRALSTLIQMQESVDEIATFTYLSRQEAEEGIKDGSIQAAIILGDTFINDVMTGINTPAIVLLPSDTELNTEVFHEEVRNGISLIRTGEAGIYSVTDTWISGYEMVISRSDMENLLTDLFTSKALDRSGVIDEFSVSAFGEDSIMQYYVASGYAMILLFFGLMFGNLYAGNDITVRKKLRVNGLGAVKTGIVRILVMTSMVFIISIMMICMILIYTKVSGISLGFYFEPAIIPGLLLIAFSLSGFFHFIYSLSNIEAQNAMILILSAILMAFMSGCIFPMAFLPEAFQKAGMLMPMRMWRTGLSQILFSYQSFENVMWLFIIGLIFGTGGIICQIRKIHS